MWNFQVNFRIYRVGKFIAPRRQDDLIKNCVGRGLCELSVLGGREFLELILSSILDGRI